jgi:ATP-binding protein involved in chromosome partitioning
MQGALAHSVPAVAEPLAKGSLMDPYSLLEPAATRVRDPLSGRSLWVAGMIQEARVDGETLKFVLTVKKEHSAEDRQRLRDAVVRNVVGAGWAGEVNCTIRVEGVAVGAPAAGPAKDPVKGMSGGGVQPHGGPIAKTPIPGVKHIVAVASGKGGVGKSTVAVNLAVALAQRGRKVGIMDSDIYGPSIPLMMHVNGRPIANEQKKILPLRAYGVECMSIGFLVDEKEPIIWRGPMVMGVVNQFLKDVDWGELDYLIVDMPPGTGDAQLTMIQAVPISGGVVVTTPNPVALLDAVRGVEMFRKLDVPVLGVVENMSWYEANGVRMYPFGQGGGVKMAVDYGVELLGQVPLKDGIRSGGDEGKPAVLSGESVFDGIAASVERALPV